MRLLECAGERGEAEAVGIEIARLLAAGVRPDDIVVALRRPSVDGPLFASVLREQGIPVALEADLPLAGTAVGRGLIALCRAAADDGAPADLLAHLRADPSVAPGAVDWLERAVARDEVATVAELASSAGRARRSSGREIARPTGRPLASSRWRPARGEWPRRSTGSRRRWPASGPTAPRSTRSSCARESPPPSCSRSWRSSAALPGCPEPDLADAAEALETAACGPGAARPRAGCGSSAPTGSEQARRQYLFCGALQEGVFPGRGAIDPLLGEESRSRLGIPALRRREQTDEERYLFHVCASRPVERLYLSWRSSDEDGHPAARSPFVDEVLDLLDTDQAEGELKVTRSLAQSVPAPTEATTPERWPAR